MLKGSLLVLRKNNLRIKTRMRIGTGLPVAVTPVVDTRAGPSVITEPLLPPGWREQAWRAPTKTHVVDASDQTLKLLGQVPVTILVNEVPMRFPFLVV